VVALFIGNCGYFQGDSGATGTIVWDDPSGYPRDCREISEDDDEYGTSPLPAGERAVCSLAEAVNHHGKSA
jgi:hypothetical protein